MSERGNGTLLQTTELTKVFGGLTAVYDVSLSVAPGTIAALIGPNGAGKTTFFNMLTGVYKPEGGRATFDGHDLTRLRPDQITALGIARTFQNIRLFNNLTALENVLAGRHSHLKAGLAESIFRWLPHRPQSRRQRLLEIVAFLPILIPLAFLALLGVVWLLGSLVVLLIPPLAAAHTAVLWGVAIVGLVLEGPALLAGLVLWGWGIVLVVRWTVQSFSVKRLLSSLALLLIPSLYPPLVYVVGSRLLAQGQGLAKNAAEEEAEAAREASELLDFVGLAGKEDWLAKNLPYGDQRRLEVARALACGPRLLLLDEPTAGMNPAETAAMIEFIRRLRDELDITILLIEHDMKVVMSISEQISVLDYGRKIAEGTPEEIQSDPKVIEAYLGRGLTAFREIEV